MNLPEKLRALADEIEAEGKKEEKPKWEPKPGEWVKAWDGDRSLWRVQCFKQKDIDGRYRCRANSEHNRSYAPWLHVAPLDPSDILGPPMEKMYLATDKDRSSYLYKNCPHLSKDGNYRSDTFISLRWLVAYNFAGQKHEDGVWEVEFRRKTE